MKSSFFTVVVCVVFLLAGTGCTLSTKWADLLSAPDIAGNVVSFEHPFFQTTAMFLGETLCFLTFHVLVFWKSKSGGELILGEDTSLPHHPLIFLIPAIADFAASTLSNVGLNLTTASVYQMLRGSTVLFTALFSFLFLKRRFHRHEYLGMLIVICGLVVVGVSSSFKSSSATASNPALGNILVVIGQAVQSAHMVYEESLIRKYRLPPLLTVGCEGLYGVVMALVVLGILEAVGDGAPDSGVTAFDQMQNCGRCTAAIVLLIVSVAFFNGTAVTITREMTAATRMVLDTLRNIIVWSITIAYSAYFHETFEWLQLVGFLCLIAGNVIYKRFVRLPFVFFDIGDEKSATFTHPMINETELQERGEPT